MLATQIRKVLSGHETAKACHVNYDVIAVNIVGTKCCLNKTLHGLHMGSLYSCTVTERTLKYWDLRSIQERQKNNTYVCSHVFRLAEPSHYVVFCGQAWHSAPSIFNPPTFWHTRAQNRVGGLPDSYIFLTEGENSSGNETKQHADTASNFLTNNQPYGMPKPAAKVLSIYQWGLLAGYTARIIILMIAVKNFS